MKKRFSKLNFLILIMDQYLDYFYEEILYDFSRLYRLVPGIPFVAFGTMYDIVYHKQVENAYGNSMVKLL